MIHLPWISCRMKITIKKAAKLSLTRSILNAWLKPNFAQFVCVELLPSAFETVAFRLHRLNLMASWPKASPGALHCIRLLQKELQEMAMFIERSQFNLSNHRPIDSVSIDTTHFTSRFGTRVPTYWRVRAHSTFSHLTGSIQLDQFIWLVHSSCQSTRSSELGNRFTCCSPFLPGSSNWYPRTHFELWQSYRRTQRPVDHNGDNAQKIFKMIVWAIN